MDLEIIRKEIDDVDDQIKILFEKRMALVLEVAEYKKQNNLPVKNSTRENEILVRVTTGQSEELAEYTKILFRKLFEIARLYQERNINKE
ncbi:MAG: chorismate mutase [Oscillospiraceae bacterium]|nr:chorismate mutase [Oscillospiraceae bacterium]